MKRAWQGWALALALGGAGVARADYVPGTTNTVYAAGTSGASYLLYLPTSYDPDAPPPLMVYFDPSANSGYGMSKLQPSCEAAGWVLACANELRNESIPNQDIKIREILDDVRRRIVYARERFYLAGLSGGSWRVQTIAREYWDEATGVLLMGCWIGDYDDYTVFPDRLAIARVNGSSDLPPAKDTNYYARSAVRVHDIVFDGGHEIGPTQSISAALAWLEEDFAEVGHTYVPAGFEAAASGLVAAAQTAWDAADYGLVASNAAAAMLRYPMSSSVRAAEQWLFRVYTNGELRAQAEWTPASHEIWAASWMLMQRGLGTDAWFPRSFARAYFEAAVAVCSTNARALAECAHQILNDPACARSEWPRAEELAEAAFQLKTNHWRAPYVQHELAAQMGDLRGAWTRLQAAMDRMPGDLGNDALSNTYEDCEEEEEWRARTVAQIPAMPVVADFERLPMNRSVDGRQGWAVPWGGAWVQTQTVHNGLCALAVTGRESLVFFNCDESTNETVWIDFYLRPARSATDFTNALPPRAVAAFYVRSNGRLRVYDGSAGAWTELAHVPLPTDAWARISVCADGAGRQWSLRLNDTEIAAGLGFVNPTSVFAGVCFLHDGEAPAILDGLTVSSNAPEADTDRDGLPDAWEQAHGLNPADPTDAALDPDGDLFANCEEWRAGTSPNEWNAPTPATVYAEAVVGGAGVSLGGLLWTNAWHRHDRWVGDVLLIATNRTPLHFLTWTSNAYAFWGTYDAEPLVPDGTGIVENLGLSLASDEQVLLQGPFNGRYRVVLDASTGEFAVEWAGFHDADGDTMMDEWEQLHSGDSTALTPYGNPDGDAYPNLAEYFGGTDPLTRDPFSGYTSVSLAGSFNNWSTTQSPMTLVGDHVWQYTLWRSARTTTLKFAANGTWDVNWGDNQQATNVVSFRDMADVDGANIEMVTTNSGYVTLTFNDWTRKYAIVAQACDSDWDGIPDDWETARYTNSAFYGAADDPDGDGWANAAEYLENSDPFAADAGIATNERITVVGNFSGWNTALNPMEPVGNHLWILDLAFTNQAGAEFKFVANNDWATAWGATGSATFALPLQALGNFQGGSPNFKPAEPLDGVYRFTFNEACGLCTLDYAPHYLLHQAPVWTEVATNRAVVLTWFSSSDQSYALYGFTNLLAEPERLRAGIRATPPLNVVTQEIDPDRRLGVFQIRLEE